MAQDTRLERLTLETAPAPQAAVIWLHGLGADGRDFEPIVPALDLPAGLGVRFVFPHAPARAVTVNGGMQMRAWYDIHGVDIADKQDEAGIRASEQAVAALIDDERQKGIAADKLVLAGFSQGGAVALHTALRFPQSLAGVLALSCYLPLHESLAQEGHPANLHTPIFMGHGNQDPVVPQILGERTRDFLLDHGYPVAWRSYAMAHAVCPQEIADIGRWLTERLG